MTVPHVPVLIVGAGPVGLALAGDLAWRGVPSMLVEKTDGTIVQPKMDLVGVRTMEFCRRWGISDRVVHSPYPIDYRQDYVYVTSLTGYELGREPFPAKQDEPLPEQSPQKRERCPQDMFDPILRGWVDELGMTDVRFERELTAFVDDGDVVTATLVDTATGEQELVTADYLVGTDGGASTVRGQLGIEMSGNDVLTYTNNAIFRCPDLLDLHDKGEAYRFIMIGPEGTWSTIVAINGGDRWRFSYVGDQAPRKMTEEEIRTEIVRAVGVEFDFEVLSIVPWIRRELVADAYGEGRVFIAGDAAHLMSPTGGFGMNTGIQDAVDLGWKLAAMVEGWGGPGLLDSYEVERRPVGLRNVNEASTNLGRMLSPRSVPLPPDLLDEGPDADAHRKEFGDEYAQRMKAEWFTVGIHLGYSYAPHSSIVVDDGSPVPKDVANAYDQTTRPGGRAPHVWLTDGRSTLDLFGTGFTLLRLGDGSPDTSAFATAFAERSVPLDVVDVGEPAVCAAYEQALVLVRPDGHVAWRGDAVPDHPGAVVDQIRGA